MKGKNLKPGDAVVSPHSGMVVKVDAKGKDPFWNKPTISFMDAHDCAYGYLTGPLNLDEQYEILVDRADIVEMYKKIDYQLLEHIHDSMDRRSMFKKVFRKSLDSMILKNKNYKKKKKS